jgi:hypothetical protein
MASLLALKNFFTAPPFWSVLQRERIPDQYSAIITPMRRGMNAPSDPLAGLVEDDFDGTPTESNE